MRKFRSNSGVTLLELLFVVIIIGILAAVFLPKLLVTTKNAAANAAAANLATCASAVQSALSKGEPPANVALILDGTVGSKVLGDFTIPGRDRLWSYTYTSASNAITATKLNAPDATTTIIYDIDDGTFVSALPAYNVTGG